MSTPSPNINIITSTFSENFTHTLSRESASIPEIQFNGAIKLVFGSILGIISLFTSLVNFLVLLAFVIVHSLLSNLSYVLILNLAVSDLMVALTVEPFTINFEFFENFEFPFNLIPFWKAYQAIELCFTLSSVLTFVVISADRWVVLAYPLRARAWRTRRLVRVMLCVIWILAIIGGMMKLASNLVYIDEMVICITILEPLFVFMPLLVMIILWGLIARIAIFSRKKSLVATSRGEHVTENTKQAAGLAEESGLNPTCRAESAIHKMSFSNNCISKRSKKKPTPKSSNSSLKEQYQSESLAIKSARNCTNIEVKEEEQKSSDLNKSIRLEEDITPLAKLSCNENNTLSNPRKTIVYHRNQQSVMRKKPESIAENRALTTAATIIGIFAICWIPYIIYMYFISFMESITDDTTFSLLLANPVMSYLHHLFNPIFYLRYNPDLHKVIKNIIRCKCWSINKLLREEKFKRQTRTTSTTVLS